MTNTIEQTSLSLGAKSPSLEDAWSWAKQMAETHKMPVSNFSAYRHSQKFNNKTQKYEDITPYYNVSIQLRVEASNDEDII